jgi:uncharacterized protein YqjF (DUF2071 family)
MKEPKVFLTARWQDLILITYDVDPELLMPHIPPGLEPDTINGRGFVSLVAFDFLDTKVKGMKIPYHINFPEINLRIYVRNKDKRGVVFVREFVPRSVIPLVANTLYNENYKAIKMSSSVKKNGAIFINHTIEINKQEFQINLQAENKPYLPPVESTEHFFKEHEWGFGTSRNGKPLIYKVMHPFWNIYPIIKFQHDFDLGLIYGKKWEILNSQSPYNVTYAEGSEIKVFEGQIIQ